jgi:transcriptional antiterminator RfaH
MSSQWYVLRSKPNKEIILWRELTARGFECFFPRLDVRPVDPRTRKIQPYFPGYLFLHIDLDQVRASTFQWMPFSNGFISFGNTLATVPENLIQAIRRRVNQINAAAGEQRKNLKRGEVVTIQGGLLDGYKAIFDARLPGRERVRVLLKLLQGHQINLELPESQVQPQKRR